MKRRTSGAVAWMAVLTFAACLDGRAAEPTAPELAEALQKKYDGVRSFTADFAHSYRGGVLNRQLNQRGRLMIKKPGKMRWEYTAPENNLFVSDGIKIYSYVPADKQVIISDMPASDNATTPALFLAGKGNLGRDFTPSLADVPAGAAPGSRALKLVPKTPQSDYDWLVVVLDPATLTLRGLVYGDPQGGTSTFLFTNLKENAVLADSSFEFKPPRGVDIVNGSSVR